VIAIRSTIIPKTTKHLQETYLSLRIVSNPEFLSERNYLADMERTDRIVIGGGEKDCKVIEDIYKVVFPQARYVITDSTTAEMIKYSANVTLAGQVMIANELYLICQQLGIDWAEVRNAIILDPLIGKNNKVPGPDNSLGFGGKCLPKDLSALIHLSKQSGHDPVLLNKIWKRNLQLRKDRNWERIKGAVADT
jgi:UDPglucose 6-dehydrogenase